MLELSQLHLKLFTKTLKKTINSCHSLKCLASENTIMSPSISKFDHDKIIISDEYHKAVYFGLQVIVDNLSKRELNHFQYIMLV